MTFTANAEKIRENSVDKNHTESGMLGMNTKTTITIKTDKKLRDAAKRTCQISSAYRLRP